jgi:electron transport complex protein RnfD
VAPDRSRFIVTSSPHLFMGDDTRGVMRDALLALLPALAASAYFFGWRALWVTGVCVGSCVGAEWAFQRLASRTVRTGDLSAAVTGILLAFCLPPGTPWWAAAVGGVVSIVLGKEVFGGLGHNIFNPALVGRAVLLASFPVQMTTWTFPARSIPSPFAGVDAVASATPLAAAKGMAAAFPHWDLFVGQVGGSIGETSALALLLGGGFLLLRGVIDWTIPAAFIVSTAALCGLLGADPLGHLLAGGLLLGAFFMATDYVTSPLSRRGRLLFGAGCGLLTVLIRLYGGFPEGVCYAILIMNSLVPLIDRFTLPVPFGGRRP